MAQEFDKYRKVWQNIIAKCDRYSKVRQEIITQSVIGITKFDKYYEVRRSKGVFGWRFSFFGDGYHR